MIEKLEEKTFSYKRTQKQKDFMLRQRKKEGGVDLAQIQREINRLGIEEWKRIDKVKKNLRKTS